MLAVMNGTVSRSVTAKALAVLGTFDPGHTRRTLSEIATAAEQQSATSEEINRSLTNINGISGEVVNIMHESAKAVQEVSTQADVLNGLMEEMKKYFHCAEVETRVISGQMANVAVFSALMD